MTEPHRTIVTHFPSLAEILKEAADVIESLPDEYRSKFRGPIVDEMHGFAGMCLEAHKTAPISEILEQSKSGEYRTAQGQELVPIVHEDPLGWAALKEGGIKLFNYKLEAYQWRRAEGLPNLEVIPVYRSPYAAGPFGLTVDYRAIGWFIRNYVETYETNDSKLVIDERDKFMISEAINGIFSEVAFYQIFKVKRP